MQNKTINQWSLGMLFVFFMIVPYVILAQEEHGGIFIPMQQPLLSPQGNSTDEEVQNLQQTIEDRPEYCTRTDIGTNPTLEEWTRGFEELSEKYQIPSLILKAMAFHESGNNGWRHFDAGPGEKGVVVIGIDPKTPTCGIGLMQVTTGTIEEFGFDVELLISDPFYNLEAGVQVLDAKWSYPFEINPMIGNNERYMLENWYYSIWLYNGGCFYDYPNHTCNHYPEELILPLMASSNDYWTSVPVTSPNIESFKNSSKKSPIQTPTPIHYTNYWLNIGTYQGEEPHTNPKSQLFLDYWGKKEFFDVPAFNKLGVPFDDGQGKLVRNWNGVILQNFRQALSSKHRFGDGDSALALNKDQTAVFLIRADFWQTYKKNNGSTAFGTPLSDAYEDSKTQGIMRQDFERNCMLWNESKKEMKFCSEIIPEEWTMLQYDKHRSGFIATAQDVQRPDAVRYFVVSDKHSSSTQPVMKNGIVYLTTADGKVRAIDGRSLSAIWGPFQFYDPSNKPVSILVTPMIVNDELIVVTNSGIIIALKLANGAYSWSSISDWTLDGEYTYGTTSPLIVNDMLTLTIGSNQKAFDLTTPDKTLLSDTFWYPWITASMATDNSNQLYIVDAVGELYVEDFRQKLELWTPPKISGYFNLTGWVLGKRAYERTEGQAIAWGDNTLFIKSEVLADPDFAYYSEADTGYIYAIDTLQLLTKPLGQNISLLWKKEVGVGKGAPVYRNGTVYVAGSKWHGDNQGHGYFSGSVDAYDGRSGASKWNISFDDVGSITIGNNTLYVAEFNSGILNIYDLRTSTPTLVQEVSVGGILSSPPAIAGDRLYISSWDNTNPSFPFSPQTNGAKKIKQVVSASDLEKIYKPGVSLLSYTRDEGEPTAQADVVNTTIAMIPEHCELPAKPSWTTKPEETARDGVYILTWDTAGIHTLEESRDEFFMGATVKTTGTESTAWFSGKDDGAYYYRVWTENTCGYGPSSDIISVTVKHNQAPYTFLLEPSDYETVHTSLPALSWRFSDNDASDAQAAWEVILSNSPNFDGSVFHYTGGQDGAVSWMPPFLSEQGLYYWKARTRDPWNAWSDWSSSNQFIIQKKFFSSSVAKFLYPHYGAAWGDMDGDGDSDLYLAGYGASDALLGNDRGVFYDITASRGVYDGLGAYGGGAVWGDYDNDGDADLLVANLNTIDYLYRNDGARFTEVSRDAGMPYVYTTYAPAFVDYDNNGYLDIVLMVYGGAVVYKNTGDGIHFQSAPENEVIGKVFPSSMFDAPKISDITGERGLQPNLHNLPKISEEKLNALFAEKKELDTASVWNGIANYNGIPYAQSWGDYDNDGDLDLYISNFGYTYDTANGAYNVLYNNYYGYFYDVTSQTGLLQARDKTWASDWGDYDGDGFLDLVVFNCGSSFLYRNNNGYFANATGATGFDKAIGCAIGGSFIDFDNDGDLDIQVVYTDADRLFRNDKVKFIDVTQDVFLSDTGGESYANANADYDSDGDLDMLATTLGDGAPSWGHDWLFTNPGFSNTFIRVIPKLAGLNRLDYGARVYEDTDGDHDFSTGGEIMRYLKPTEGKGSQGEGVLHIGVKDASTVDVRVQFTNRATVLKYKVLTGKTITIMSSDPSDPFPGASVPDKPSELRQFAGTGDDILWGSYTRERFPHFSFKLSDSKTKNTLGVFINIDDDGVYEGDVGDVLNFTSPVAFASGSVQEYTASKELSDGSYYWRVKAVNSEEAKSGWVYAYDGMNVFTIDETSPKSPASFTAKAEADAIALAWALEGEEGGQGTEKAKSMPAEIVRQPFVQGEFLAVFKHGKERRLNALSKIVSKEKAIERLSFGVYKITLKNARDFDAVFKEYERDPDVLSLSPNYLITTDELPNDAEFPKLWGLHNTGQTGGTPDADIDAPEAWNAGAVDAHSAVVAVLDTGVDYTHPDLLSHIWSNEREIAGNGIDDDGNGFIDDTRGWDMTMCNERDGNGVCLSPKTRDNDPMDEHGHGTHVSGTIGAVGWNGIGVIGVNPNARIMPVRFLDKNGVGTTSDAIDAIYYAAQNGALVINMSFGGGGFSQPFLDAILFTREKGALFVAAAGNNNANNDSSPQYPSSYDADNLIAVSATDVKDALASFSNYGAVSVDIAAPGTDIVSTIRGGGYVASSGTSMATAYVSGAAAYFLGMSEQPGYGEVRTALLDTVDLLGALTGKVASGGRLNLANGLKYVRGKNSIARFVIYREVEPFQAIDERTRLADIADTSVRSYIDTAVDSGITYYYALIAEDAAGNRSAPVFTDSVSLTRDQVLSGWSWSSTIGWISFSCKNREAATGKTCKDANDHSFDPSTNLIDYGVLIDGVTGAFSGNAWNDRVGWMSFEKNDTGAPPSSPYNDVNQPYIAHLEGKDGDANRSIIGWARALIGKTASDWDGWIKLSGIAEDGSQYGVSLNKDTKEFSGWMYGGDLLGWISANCADRGVCATALYGIQSDALPIPPSPSLPNPIALWKLDEGTGTIANDSSGNGNTGTIQGGAEWTSGISGTALQFDGIDDFVSIKQQLFYGDKSDFTVSVWYKGTDTVLNSYWGRGLVGRNNNDIYANLVIRGGYALYSHYDNAWKYNIQSNTFIADGTWHNIVYVNHGTTETGDLYIDGVKEIANQSSSISNDNYPFRIDGFMVNYTNAYTSGAIDDVQVYASSLTSAQAAALYATTAPASTLVTKT